MDGHGENHHAHCLVCERAGLCEARNLIMAVDTSLEEAHVSSMLKTLQGIHKAGDMVYLLHCTGKLRVDLHNDQAFALEENYARKYIKENYASKLEELKIPYTLEIYHTCLSKEGIGAIIAARADELKAHIVIMAKHHRRFVEKLFIGSVTCWVEHHSKVPVMTIPVN